MNPDKETIDSWIAKASDGGPNDIIEFSITGFTDEPDRYFKKFIIEMMTQVDRWDLANMFVHPHMLKLFTAYLQDDISIPYYTSAGIQSGINRPVKEIQLWGMSIVANPNVPEDTLVGFGKIENPAEDDGRNIVLGKLNLNLLNRLNRMKVFW